jgi:hypothetical protein
MTTLGEPGALFRDDFASRFTGHKMSEAWVKAFCDNKKFAKKETSVRVEGPRTTPHEQFCCA